MNIKKYEELGLFPFVAPEVCNVKQQLLGFTPHILYLYGDEWFGKPMETREEAWEEAEKECNKLMQQIENNKPLTLFD